MSIVETGLLAERLRRAGVLLLECDVEGHVRSRPHRDADWLADLCGRAPLVLRELHAAAAEWSDADEPAAMEAVPGVWLVPLVVGSRRRRLGYHVAVLVTPRLLEAEHLAAMCQSAELDRSLVRSLLAALPPVSGKDVPRTIQLIRDGYGDRQLAREQEASVENVGKQLAESYEEINLLYTIIQSMTVAQPPRRFVTAACRELLETLSYRWIGAQFQDDHPWVDRLGARFIMAGESDQPLERLQQLGQLLLERAKAGGPVVVEPALNPEDAMFRELGRAVLVHPVSREGQRIGILIAADKQGEDTAASSADMKLLGATATHLAIFLENASLYDDLNAMFMGTLEALTASIDAKDRYTCGHSLRVAHLTRQLAEAAGVDEETVARMRIAGLVHDVGKIGVPERVLASPGRLNEEEFAWIRKHPEIGHRILKDIPQLSDVLPGVLHHHERWDGEGYPARLAGEEIPLVARIIALADAFDAMSSTRTYRAAMSRDEVLAEIVREAGRQFDPTLAPLFVRLDFRDYDRLVNEHRAQSVVRPTDEGVAA